MSEPDEIYEDDTLRYWQHRIERRDPVGTMIIQGHALLEEELNAFIAEAFKNPKAVDRFGFRQKIQLLKAFCSPDERSHQWKIIEKLTDLRNLVAHRPVDGSTEERIAIIGKLREEVNPPEELNPLQVELDDEIIIQMAFAYATGAIQAMVEETTN